MNSQTPIPEHCTNCETRVGQRRWFLAGCEGKFCSELCCFKWKDKHAPRIAHDASKAGYPNALAAAQNASEAAAELLRCAREEDAVPIEDVLEKLLDAARLVAEIEMREEDAQVLGAIARWIEGDR